MKNLREIIWRKGKTNQFIHEFKKKTLISLENYISFSQNLINVWFNIRDYTSINPLSLIFYGFTGFSISFRYANVRKKKKELANSFVHPPENRSAEWIRPVNVSIFISMGSTRKIARTIYFSRRNLSSFVRPKYGHPRAIPYFQIK